MSAIALNVVCAACGHADKHHGTRGCTHDAPSGSGRTFCPCPLAQADVLRAGLVRASEDTARLDWLCEEARFKEGVQHLAPDGVMFVIGYEVNFPGDVREDFRKAIDANRLRALAPRAKEVA